MSIKVVSLFSGGGGLDLGFKKAGYDIIWAVDNNPNAVETYRANLGNHIICEDITKIDPSTIPHADVVIGGPPCQSFSLAGKRNVEDERGQLVWQYIRIIDSIKPKAFLFENVPGLLSAKNSNGERIFTQLKQSFEEIGYTVNAQLVNAADYGIPQKRYRVLIVGTFNGKVFVFPKATHGDVSLGLKPYISVKEAIGDLPSASVNENARLKHEIAPFSSYQKRMRDTDSVTEHFIPKMSDLDKYIISHVKPGGNYMDIPSDVPSQRIRRLQRDGGHTTCYGRMLPDEPSYTINTYFNRPNVGCNIHYAEDRLITVREALRLQSFPDSFVIVSSSKQGRNLIVGNAVPPLLAEIMANELKKYIKEEYIMGIKYSDSEVNVFHPLCEQALNAALQKLKLQKKYKVIHHQYTGSLEMDFCIQNQATKKYLCVIEVKRTPADVHSSRYQFQALSYVQSNEGNNEKPFYILTNLEYAFTFRYDKNRPRVFQQMLKPGLTSICTFGSMTDQDIVDKLTDYFAKTINSFTKDSYDYLVTLDEFAKHMEQIKNSPKLWKSHLAVLLYEYIRGAFTYINRNDLKDIRLFNGDVKRICDEAVRINFKDIFTYDPNEFESKVTINGNILADLFDFGSQNINGDSVAGVLHQIVSYGQEHNGEVPTDLELGTLVAELAKSISGDLSENEKLCDPAAGSGNLISSAIGVFNISSSQIVVNDINSKLLELLSLRLGLGFPKTICKTTSPTIECKNIADIDSSFFADVKVVVMNPPFVGGIYCVDRKPPLYKKIRELTKATPISDVGQMPLEGVFLELITHLVPKGTTIACIISKTHLMGRGPESQAIRRIILNKFGLRIVFTYPGKEIFDKVTKDTCVIVGKAMTPSESVNIYSSYDKVPDIDTHTFAESLKVSLTESFKPIMAGILAKSVQAEQLEQCIADGWRELNSEMIEAIEFTDRHLYSLAQLVKLGDLKIPIKRGTAGNNGGSDLLFFDSNTALFNKHKTSVSIGVAMRNAYYDSLDIGLGDSKFLVESKSSAQAIDDVLTDFLAIPLKPGKQPKKSKSKADLMAILKKEGANIFKGNAVLIPRDIRKNGKIYYSKSPVYVSTNFIVCNFASPDAALLVSTWMTTVFYQLICEVSSKDQEGARKMEKKDILTTLIPDLSKVSDDLVKAVKAEKDNITFLDLQNPVIRKIDRIWAKELFGKEADIRLNEAVRLLEFLARKRNS